MDLAQLDAGWHWIIDFTNYHPTTTAHADLPADFELGIIRGNVIIQGIHSTASLRLSIDIQHLYPDTQFYVKHSKNHNLKLIRNVAQDTCTLKVGSISIVEGEMFTLDFGIAEAGNPSLWTDPGAGFLRSQFENATCRHAASGVGSQDRNVKGGKGKGRAVDADKQADNGTENGEAKSDIKGKGKAIDTNGETSEQANDGNRRENPRTTHGPRRSRLLSFDEIR